MDRSTNLYKIKQDPELTLNWPNLHLYLPHPLLQSHYQPLPQVHLPQGEWGHCFQYLPLMFERLFWRGRVIGLPSSALCTCIVNCSPSSTKFCTLLRAMLVSQPLDTIGDQLSIACQVPLYQLSSLYNFLLFLLFHLCCLLIRKALEPFIHIYNI